MPPTKGKMTPAPPSGMLLLLLSLSSTAASAAAAASYGSPSGKGSSSSSSSGCSFPQSWRGKWFHLGFPEPLRISEDSIAGKGACVRQSGKNMFLLKESDSDETCYRCMMIYEKHFNVLQYKESYCEEDIESMESLCNMIAGDAPLYTMFRKAGDLVKCPFRGPFSFSYSKGGRGQVCAYPSSYLDSCGDNQKMKLKYQACLDVEGSEVASEEMSCLATWKEGSSRYLVALMNHSHVYTDESRYRCFVYRRTRQHDDADDKGTVYKMAQSSQASCLGLWNVDEGYRTFTLTKLGSEKRRKCAFPTWLNYHHDWHSIEGNTSIHVNSGHSLKLDGAGTQSHVTCHEETAVDSATTRVVAHIKSGCESGFVCMLFHKHDDHVLHLRVGRTSHHPSEACMSYHFDDKHTPLQTLVSGKKNTRTCPFSGRYSLTGSHSALTGLLDVGGEGECHTVSYFMQAGCSESSDLHVESTCHPRPVRDPETRRMVQNDAPINVRNEFTCHGQWATLDAATGGDGAAMTTRQLLLLSSPRGPGEKGEENSVSRKFMCLEFTDADGIMSATAIGGSCDTVEASSADLVSLEEEKDLFNITSSGPCLQALTGDAARPASSGLFIVVAGVAVSASLLRLK